MLESPIFPGFRRVWEADAAVLVLMERADGLVQDRNKRPSRSPSSESIGSAVAALHIFKQLCDSIPQPDSGGPFQFYRAYAAAICRLQPLIDAAKWPRWLLLERALSSASASGDLLAAALVLRTQIEALDDLLTLEFYEQRLPSFSQLGAPFSVANEDCLRIRGHAELLWFRFLPMLEVPSKEAMTQQPGSIRRPAPRPVELAEAFGALNDYVHPNYGSHIQAIWPEQAEAAEVLLKAFVTIYTTFLHLPWTRQGAGAAERHTGSIPAVTSWSQRMTFVHTTLPELSKALIGKHGYPKEWKHEGPMLNVFRERIMHDQDQWTSWAHDFDASAEKILEPLRPICSAFCPTVDPLSWKQICLFPMERSGLGLPATIADWLSLSALRRHGKTLEEAARTLGAQNAFPEAPPYDNWITFLKTAVEFSIMVGAYQMGLMRVAAMRNLNEKNLLGATLATRSVMEHYAVTRWLSGRFGLAWDGIEDAARSGRDLRSLLSDLEADVGRFLAGTKQTAEATKDWRKRWISAGRARHINLETAVKKAFEGEDNLRFLYEWFCRVVHGDKLSGSDLLEPGSETLTEKQFAKLVLVLHYFERPEVLFGLFGPVFSAVSRMARPGGLRTAGNADSVRGAVRKGIIRKLNFTLGRDFFGNGSETDPYYFRPELVYHVAFYAFLEHQEIRDFIRSTWLFQRYPGDQVQTKDGRRIYFWNRYPQLGADPGS